MEYSQIDGSQSKCTEAVDAVCYTNDEHTKPTAIFKFVIEVPENGKKQIAEGTAATNAFGRTVFVCTCKCLDCVKKDTKGWKGTGDFH